jgi:catechol 2,3-dioxygenase-like lactoylglutathione lyase family enzyme
MSEASEQIDHVTITVRDLPQAQRFYAAVLGTLGLRERTDRFGRVAYGANGREDFGMYDASTGEGFRHAHIGFVAPSRAAVDDFHAAALAAGGQSLAGPKDRPEFGRGCYNCYVTDAEGNGLEAAYRPP